MIARLATPNDIGALIKLGLSAHASSNLKTIPFNAGVTRETFSDAILMKGADVIVADHDGEITGFLIADISQLPFARRRCATDVVFYADRGGDEILEYFKEWCRIRRVVRIYMGVTQPEEADVKDRFFRKHGFEKLGGVYMLELRIAE